MAVICPSVVCDCSIPKYSLFVKTRVRPCLTFVFAISITVMMFIIHAFLCDTVGGNDSRYSTAVSPTKYEVSS